MSDMRVYRDVLKRPADIILAGILLIPIGVLVALTGVLVAIVDGAPVFFVQTRVGRHARLFNIIKLRTMTPAPGITTITTAVDQRITPLGRLLRRWKLDEMPQLWNVLKGEMSFVGPRPDVPGYYERLTGPDRVLLRLRPGVTGPASLAFRDEEDLLAGQSDPKSYNDNVLFPAKTAMNVEYYNSCSLLGDLRILIRTAIGR
jgi:lipopolysaccharide/colanic/teichoic acid biosynthesis glycosyltransferase